jgi:hypothetical protein
VGKRTTVGRFHVSLSLFRGETRIAWGDLLATTCEGCTVFGGLYDAQVYPTAGPPLNVQMSSGLVIDHSTDGMGAKLFLRLYDLVDTGDPAEPTRQVLVFKTATRFPTGYESADEEVLPLVDEYQLRYRARWLAESSSVADDKSE